ncbi:hypothetical protein J7E96_32285 [Streptomyces sp. ISL-96]|uniref:hypothetical protein n=1 Tax=Streptomyces sp. ISL-96 TaxID=2819191 RepID=UPI001BE5BFFF|nr:hypothetical protein [Streptomyces sp. ISL-96]MBT2493106.1 hypothetical protein [Streptomyces sp. ISL-96]
MSSMEPRRGGYSVPAGRPYALSELRGKLGSVGDQISDLYDGSHPLEYEPIADTLYVAFKTAAELAPVKSYTGCDLHPNGAIDPEAPNGWGRCLLCNDRRRRGERSVPAPAEQRRLGYPVPDPPYTLDALKGYVQRVNDRAFAVTVSSPGEEFVDLADTLHRAFIVARELSRPRNASGCSEHPGSPIDPTAPPGEGCLFCVGRRRQRQRPPGAPQMLPQVRRGERRTIQRRFERPPGL